MWWHLIPLLRGELNHVINSENSDGSFSSKSDRVDFRNHRLKHTCLKVISWFTINQIKPTEFQLYFLGISFALFLRSCVKSSQLWDQLSSIFCSIGCQCFGDYVQCLTELRNCNLLFAAVLPAKLIEMNT